MKKYCYLNGKIIELAKAGIPLNDIGLLRSYAVFDFLRTENGKPFLFKEHFARFQNSAKILELKVPIKADKCLSILKQLLKKNKVTEANFRLVLTGGPTNDGLSFTRPNFFILVEELYSFPPKVFANGGKLITYEHERQWPEAKTTNHLMTIKLQKTKKKAGAVEILYVSRGKVLEASTSNFFLVKGNTLVTPKNNILTGTTSNLVITLAKKVGMSVEERDMFVGELTEASEAFITATNKKITPVVEIDTMRVGKGRVGEKTKMLMAAFAEHVIAKK